MLFSEKNFLLPIRQRKAKVGFGSLLLCGLCALCGFIQSVPPSAQGQTQQANAASVRSGYEAREKQLLAEIQKRPADAKLYNELGVQQFYLGKSAAAEAAFLKAIQLDPQNADARANLSFHYYQSGKPEAALDLLQAALTIDPENFLANYYSGLLYFRRQQPTRAEIFLKKALALQPNNLDVRLDLIKVSVANGEIAEAEQQLDRMATEHAGDARVRYARAAFYASQGRKLEALSEYKTVLALAPESSGIYLEMAMLNLQSRDYYGAIALLEEFHKSGLSIESSYLMGFALAEVGRLDEAETWLQRALAGREDYFDAHFQLGRLYFTKRNTAEAMRHLRRAVALNETHIEARYLLGFCLELANDLEGAMAQYQEILRLAPTRFEGYHGVGSVLLKQGEANKALANLSRAAQFNPRDADVQYLYGRALARAGNNSGAIDHLQAAVALDPKRVDAHYQLATALKRAGRQEEADRHFKIAEQLNAEFRNRSQKPE